MDDSNIKDMKILGMEEQDAAQYAKWRQSLSLKDFALMICKEYAEACKNDKLANEFFSQGGGASWETIIKAIEDDSELGKIYLEQFRQLGLAELQARGINGHVKQLEKPLLSTIK